MHIRVYVALPSYTRKHRYIHIHVLVEVDVCTCGTYVAYQGFEALEAQAWNDPPSFLATRVLLRQRRNLEKKKKTKISVSLKIGKSFFSHSSVLFVFSCKEGGKKWVCLNLAFSRQSRLRVCQAFWEVLGHLKAGRKFLFFFFLLSVLHSGGGGARRRRRHVAPVKKERERVSVFFFLRDALCGCRRGKEEQKERAEREGGRMQKRGRSGRCLAQSPALSFLVVLAWEERKTGGLGARGLWKRFFKQSSSFFSS